MGMNDLLSANAADDVFSPPAQRARAPRAGSTEQCLADSYSEHWRETDEGGIVGLRRAGYYMSDWCRLRNLVTLYECVNCRRRVLMRAMDGASFPRGRDYQAGC